jgi:uncharacterized protein YndB with AHSA1/START domain
MTDLPPLTNASFTVERVYPHPPARVFFAHADQDAVRRWRVDGHGFHVTSHTFDFREGGREVSAYRFGDGPDMTFAAEYHVIVPDRRIVSTYAMTMGGAPMSVSLLTIELIAEGAGTRLVLTEQGAYFGDPAGAKGREEGMRELLEVLATELDAAAVS